jgi:ESCRT-II complex subunit VPS36
MVAKIRIDIDPTSRTSSNIFIKLSFKEGGRDEFYEPLEHTLSRRAWQDVQPSHIADRRLQKREFSASDAGIAGILRRQEEAKKETTDLANAAFSDLNHLMNKAKDMVT